LKPT